MTTYAFEVSPAVSGVQQPNTMACWAAASTMMLAWKNNTSYGIRDALQQYAADFVAIFDNNTGLSAADKNRLLPVLGLTAEASACFDASGWDSMLRRFGPLWVTTARVLPDAVFVHARILVGIAGDGTADGTTFHLIDPADGGDHLQSWQSFADAFEAEAANDAANTPPGAPLDVSTLRVQILHW